MTCKFLKRSAVIALLLLLLALLTSCQPAAAPIDSADFRTQSTRTEQTQAETTPLPSVDEYLSEDSILTSMEDVSLYLITYDKLPGNYITKAKARTLGWSGGDLRPYAENSCIGGDRFGNYEGRLPEKRGRVYHECDIDTLGWSSRGSKRLVYSNDGLIFFTDDHYENFTLLYTEDGCGKLNWTAGRWIQGRRRICTSRKRCSFRPIMAETWTR